MKVHVRWEAYEQSKSYVKSSNSLLITYHCLFSAQRQSRWKKENKGKPAK